MYAFCCIWKTYFQKGTSGLLSQLPRVSVIFTSRASKVEWEGTEGSMEEKRTGGARALQRRLLWVRVSYGHHGRLSSGFVEL